MTRIETIERIGIEIAARTVLHPMRVCIDGIDAAGKTTFADELGKSLETRGFEVIRASIDGFHNPREIRLRKGEFSPEGYYHDSFDYDSLGKLLLAPLGPEGKRRYRSRVFDFRSDVNVESDWRLATDASILIMDGVFMLRSELASLWDYSIFLKVSFEQCLKRALVRDRELFQDDALIRRKYSERYIPGQRIYLERDNPEARASIVVDNEDFRAPRILTTQ